MKCQRGGHTLKTGKIGGVNCLRQQIMMPGERMNLSMEGKVRLESLRERDVLRINAHLATFMTPLRWLVPNWTDYVREGPQTAEVIPSQAWFNFDQLGIGARTALVSNTVSDFWVNAYLRCYNEYYKWPEDIDGTSVTLKADGHLPAVPLAKTWNRTRYDTTPTATETELASVTEFDVRDLAQKQAEFRSAMKREVLSFNRWMELVKDTWGGQGSREVDQVPQLLDSTEVGVNPREIPATDGASLGQWQSLFDFNVDHQVKGIIAPEHCIITTMLTLRFAGTLESLHPLTNTLYNDWYTMTGDPEYLSSAAPELVDARELLTDVGAVDWGYLPAGWQWRCDSDVIGAYIDTRDSFPYMETPDTLLSSKDATRVKSAFRSQALQDYVVDVFFKEDCNQPIGDSMDSYFSGMADDTKPHTTGKGEFPKGGKML